MQVFSEDKLYPRFALRDAEWALVFSWRKADDRMTNEWHLEFRYYPASLVGGGREYVILKREVSGFLAAMYREGPLAFFLRAMMDDLSTFREECATKGRNLLLVGEEDEEFLSLCVKGLSSGATQGKVVVGGEVLS